MRRDIVPPESDEPNLGILRDHVQALLDGIPDSCDLFGRDARVDDVKEGDRHWLLVREDVLHRRALRRELNRKTFFRDVVCIVLRKSIPGSAEIADPELIPVIHRNVRINQGSATAIQCRVLYHHQVLEILQRRYILMKKSGVLQ
jgi:hypothetical protein